MTILLSGARGRVAGQLLPGLADAHTVRLLDSMPATGDAPGEELVGDLTDPQVLDRALDGVDAVVHQAGNPDPDAGWQDLRHPNVEGFVALLAAASRHGVERVVFASSVHAMGAHEGARRWPIDPTWPPAPCCAYGATKAFDEALARAYAYRTEMSLVGLRPGLCAEDATRDEAAAGWLAPVDLRQIVHRALVADVRFGVYPAVSWASRARWDLSTSTTELGYQPARDLTPGCDAGGDTGGDTGDTDGDEPPRTDHLCTCAPDALADG